MAKKTTLTLSPAAYAALNSLPSYIRKAEYLRQICAIDEDAYAYSTKVVAPSMMRPHTLALSDKVLCGCVRLKEWLDDFDLQGRH